MDSLLFQSLPFNARRNCLVKKGQYVCERSYYAQRVALYSLGKIFVEAWYDLEEEKISKIEEISLSRTEKLYCGMVKI